MREQYTQITRSDMLQILPESLRRKLDAEAERILAQIIQMINYSTDIRMD